MAAPPLKRPWTADDIARLIHMRDVEHKTWREIDIAFGRARSCSQLKYTALRIGSPRAGQLDPAGRVALSPEQAANLSARRAAENRMTMTQTLFGDPPPGFSALDRRQP